MQYGRPVCFRGIALPRGPMQKPMEASAAPVNVADSPLVMTGDVHSQTLHLLPELLKEGGNG